MFFFLFLAHRLRTIKVSQTIRRHQHCHLSEHKSQNKTTFQTLAHHWFRYILQYLFSKWSKHATDTASPCLRIRNFKFLFTVWPHLNWFFVCRCLLKKQQHFFLSRSFFSSINCQFFGKYSQMFETKDQFEWVYPLNVSILCHFELPKYLLIFRHLGFSRNLKPSKIFEFCHWQLFTFSLNSFLLILFRFNLRAINCYYYAARVVVWWLHLNSHGILHVWVDEIRWIYFHENFPGKILLRKLGN